MRKRVCTQTYEEAERVFVDAQPDLNSLMEHMKRKSGRKRKRD